MANKYSIKDYENIIQVSFPGWKYRILSYDGYKKPIRIQCLTCGKIYNYTKAGDINRKINACECYTGFKDYHEKIQYLGQVCGFEVLEDINSQRKKKIKCLKCGCIMEREMWYVF